MLKYKLCLTIVLLFILSVSVFSQNRKHRHRHQHGQKNGIVYGTVWDDSTREALPGVNIVLLGTNIGAASGPDGNYIIRGVPPGEYTLRATMMGYDIIQTPITVQPRSETSLNLYLKPSVIEMNEIVVTGTGMPQLYAKSPIKTAVVQRDVFERQKVNNLAEALDFQTGVRVEGNCQNCNFTQVRLLGLEGHYTQILIDSDPVISSLAGVYGLEQLPQEMIERVEIVKGGGSSLYGGQAIGGVVNLITRRPSHNEFNLDYNNGTVSSTRDHRFGGSISRVNASGTVKGILFGTARRRLPYDHNGDGFSELGELKNEAIGANIFITPHTKSELSVQLHYIHEDRRGGNKFHLVPHEADIAEWAQTDRYGGSVAWTQRPTPFFDYKAYASFALTNRNTYYGAEQDPHAYGTTDNPLFVSGLRTNYRWGRHATIVGLQYSQDSIHDVAVAYNREIDDTYSSLGFILQDTYTLGAQNSTELVYGARVDKHSAIQSLIVSPRIALKSNLSNEITLRSGYSSGFKAPQVFDEDLHITQVGGEGQIIRNRSDLKEERGHTFFSGLEYQDIFDVVGLKLGVNGFYTRLENTFLLTEGDDPATNAFEFYRINGPGLRVQGVEAEFGVRLRKVELLSGVTFQSSLLDEPEPDFGSNRIYRTPNVYGSLRCTYDVSTRFNLMFTSKYTGSMYVPHYAGYIAEDRLEKAKSFLTFDLIASYRVPLAGDFFGTLTAGVYNISNDFQNDFDSGIYRDAGYIYGPLVPRRVLVGFSVGHDH